MSHSQEQIEEEALKAAEALQLVGEFLSKMTDADEACLRLGQLVDAFRGTQSTLPPYFDPGDFPIQAFGPGYTYYPKSREDLIGLARMGLIEQDRIKNLQETAREKEKSELAQSLAPTRNEQDSDSEGGSL